jgi:HK97 family phage major capsid protein
MNLKELRTKLKTLADQMSALATLESMTDEQQAQFDKLDAEFHEISAQIGRQTKAEAAAAAAQAAADAVQPAAGELQATAVAAEPVPVPAQDGGRRLIGEPAHKEFECFEQYLAAVLDASQGRRFDARLDFHEGVGRRSAEQQMGVGADGGFMVPTEFRAQLLEVDPAQTPLLANSTRLPAGTNPDAEVKLPALDQSTNQHGGVTVSRIDEGDEKPETTGKLSQVGWTPTEIGAHIALTEKLIRNWSGATGLAQRLLRGALNEHIENEVYRGDGVAKPLGIIASPAAYKINRATANDFTFADVADMTARFMQRKGKAFWLYNQLLLSKLIQMKDGNNNLVWQQSIVPGSPSTLWGLPAFPYEFASAVGALGDVALVRPDPYYVIKDGAGPFVDMGRIDKDFTKGKVRVRIFMSNDGGPWLKAPFKLQNGTEVSPFVLLDIPSP